MTTFKCCECGKHWTEGATRDYCETELCRECVALSAVNAYQEATAALDLVSRIRFALGDNGKRMQDELIEWCKTLGPRWTPTTTPPEGDA
jgi:hypothetical protein